MKVAILYRVIQQWRLDVFNDLAKYYDLTVYYGDDFKNSKVKSTKQVGKFNAKKLFTFQFTFKGSYGKGYIGYSPFLFFRLLQDQPDVIISEGKSNFFNALQGFLYCKIFRKRFIWWSLGTLGTGPKTKKFSIQIVNLIEQSSDGILTYSEQGKRYFQSIGIKESKIFVANNMICTRSIDPLYILQKINQPINIEKVRILFIGALIPSKKLDILFNALDLLNDPRLSLTIVGQGTEYSSLSKLAKSLKISDSIIFKGENFFNLERIFLNSDLFILPGLGGLGISHAMAHGLPVICSNGDGVEKDLVKNGYNGYFLNELNVNTLKQCISHITSSRELLSRMRINAFTTIYKDFTYEKYIENIRRAVEKDIL